MDNLLHPIAGQIPGVFDTEQLHHITSVLKKCDSILVQNNLCHGVNEEHLLYKWFVSECFQHVKDTINDKKMELLFGMYLDERRPWGIHTDANHTKDFKNKIPAYSILLPLSVDMKSDLVDKTHTIIFNQVGDDDNEEFPIIDDGTEVSDNFYRTHLSHEKATKVKKYSLFNIFQWKRGDLIYWKSRHYHDSDNFLANGFTSKQAIVMHTYYKV